MTNVTKDIDFKLVSSIGNNVSDDFQVILSSEATLHDQLMSDWSYTLSAGYLSIICVIGVFLNGSIILIILNNQQVIKKGLYRIIYLFSLMMCLNILKQLAEISFKLDASQPGLLWQYNRDFRVSNQFAIYVKWDDFLKSKGPNKKYWKPFKEKCELKP